MLGVSVLCHCFLGDRARFIELYPIVFYSRENQSCALSAVLRVIAVASFQSHLHVVELSCHPKKDNYQVQSTRLLAE